MRTTVSIDDKILVLAKRLAARTGRTLSSVIEDALREALARRRRSGKRKPARLTTVGGKGLQPGVDLDDSASLLDLMEGVHAAD